MFKFLFSLIAFILASSWGLVFAQSQGDKHAYILGGGGEPRSKAFTIFDSTLRTTGESLRSSNWPVTVRFNGGHADTEKIITEQFGRENADGFNPQTFKSTIADIKQRMLVTRSPNAQFLIVIDSHGAMRIDQTNEKTHSISASQTESGLDLNSLKGSITVSLDELKEIAELAEKKNIRLGIIDLSCHGGATLKLSNKNTCVVSASSDSLYAYANFGSQLFSNIKPGTNLEDAFLETRINHHETSLPQISTESGQALYEMEKDGLDSFLYYFSSSSNYGKLPELLSIEATQAANCSPSSQRLEKAIAKLEATTRSAGVANIDVRTLRSKLAKYHKVQAEIESILKSWGVPELENKETFELETIVNSRKKIHRFDTLSWSQLLTGDWKGNEAYYRKLSNNEKDPVKKAELTQNADLMALKALRRDEVLKRHPNLLDYKKKAQELVKSTKDTVTLAGEVAKAERQIYQQIYKAHAEREAKKNVCKDFTF